MDQLSIVEALLVAGVVAALAAAALALTRDVRLKHRLERMPATRIESVEDGDYVKLVGSVEYHGDPLAAPASGESCVYFIASREVRVASSIAGDPSKKWAGAGDHEEAMDFLLRQHDGAAAIVRLTETSGAVTVLVHPEAFRTLAKDDQPEVRYREAVVSSGTSIVVVGLARWALTTGAPLSASAVRGEAYRTVPRDLTIYGTEDDPLFVMVEAPTTVCTTERSIMRRTSRRHGATALVRVCVRPGKARERASPEARA